MNERFKLATTPHRLDGKLSAHIAEIARKFHAVATLGIGLTVDDIDRLESEFAAMRDRAEELETGGHGQPDMPSAADYMRQAEGTIHAMWHMIVTPGRRDVTPAEASAAIDGAIATLVAARAEVVAGNLRRTAGRRAS